MTSNQNILIQYNTVNSNMLLANEGFSYKTNGIARNGGCNEGGPPHATLLLGVANFTLIVNGILNIKYF